MLGLFNNLSQILISVPVTLIALTVHECAHGYVSAKLGDPTPRIQGRLTFNPFAHLDLMGTLLMILTGFGWAKPVQVNPMYYKDRKKGMALVALAGPLSNFLLAFVAVLLMGVISNVVYKTQINMELFSAIYFFLYFFAFRNLCFMVFNLIPLPPLDGAKVLGMFLPNRLYYTMLQYEQYFIFVLMALSLMGAFDYIIGGGVDLVMQILIRLVSLIF